MKIARVVGNVVSTIKDEGHLGYKLMLVEYLTRDMRPDGPRQIVFDAADAGIGDIVLVNTDGGAANMLLEDKEIIADAAICGVLDSLTIDGETSILIGV
jgi:microcompartment protein CcmK/EutM